MKKQPELTPWFNIAKHGQPVRIGFYEIAYTPGDPHHALRYWSGESWLAKPKGIQLGFGNIEQDKYNESWRGLASDPKVKK